MKLHKSETAPLLIAGLPRDIDKWKVLEFLERVGPGRGLSVLDLDFMRALIRLTHAGDWVAGHRPAVYASNDDLARRTGIAPRTVQRRLKSLTEQGLIAKVGPAHGRRYARRDAKGKLIALAGFDLSPSALLYLHQPQSLAAE